MTTRTTLPVSDRIYDVGALRRFPELLCAISTRLSPEGEDWNLSAKRASGPYPASPSRALANRERLARRLGISADSMVGCQQVHGNVVATVGPANAGAGIHPGVLPLQGADAMVTDTPGIYLLALSADCPPVFLYDPVRRVVGLAHSGWKGTVGRVAGNTVAAMRDRLGADPASIVAVMGPGIGPCCYAVGQNVADAVEVAFPAPWEGDGTLAPLLEARDGGVYFNLWEGIRRALIDEGVEARNIALEEVCTAHNTGTFFSHRAERGACGLFGAVLGLREDA